LARPLPIPPLLVITDRKQARWPLEDVLAVAFAGGCRWASIREKDLPADQQVALARQLLPVARQHGAYLTLHGDPALAKKAGLDGVHLAAHGDAVAARELLGADALIGISIHGPAEAERLDPELLDYAIAGPVCETASKPGYGPALGLAGLLALAALSRIPLVAIGGVHHGVIDELRTAGTAGVAVMGGVMRAADPGGEVMRLVAALEPTQRPA
jgi:thiamine-phosphate pyrophosphorylase